MTVTDHDPQATTASTPTTTPPAGHSPDQPARYSSTPRRGALAGRSLAPHPTSSSPKPTRPASGGGISDPQARAHPTPTTAAPAGHSPDQPAKPASTPTPAALAGRSLAPHPTSSSPKPTRPASGGGISVEPDPTNMAAKPNTWPSGGFDELRILAESFADAQDIRKRIANRLRSGTIPPDLAKSILDEQDRVEKMIGTAMRKTFRRVAPDIHAWVKHDDQRGIGEHLVARLIGAIGHPVIATPHHWEGEGSNRQLIPDPPFYRNVAKLWAYCGHGDPNRRKTKGMSVDDAFALGNPTAKMLVHLIAESCVKAGIRKLPDAGTEFTLDSRVAVSRYGQVYLDARARYMTRDWTPGRQQNAALRLVGKVFLKDLWRAVHPDAPERTTP